MTLSDISTSNNTPIQNLSEDLLELFPIKLIGGFISIDSHIGCSGCAFCLARRSPICNQIFKENVHHSPAWLTAQLLFELLQKMPSFTKAQVPIRFGHNTDSFFQWEVGVELAALLPTQYPFVILTRNPVSKEKLTPFIETSDAILKLTITPKSSMLQYTPELDALIETAHNTPKERLFILIGPVAQDSTDAVKSILKRLPSNIFLDIKDITVDGIGPLNESMRPSQKVIAELRAYASSMGFFVTDYFTCLTRSKTQRPLFKYHTAPSYMKESCTRCPNLKICQTPLDEESTLSKITTLGKSIGLSLTDYTTEEDGTLSFDSDTPVSRGDETYLCEMVNYPIRINTRKEGTEGGCFSDEGATVLERWQEFNFYPTSEMIAITQKLANELPIEVHHGKA